MIGKILKYAVAVILAAALTLAALLTVVQGTMEALSIESVPLRIAAVLGDVAVGMFLLVGCMWLATRLAVVLLGVGSEPFPPLPDQPRDEAAPKN